MILNPVSHLSYFFLALAPIIAPASSARLAMVRPGAGVGAGVTDGSGTGVGVGVAG